MKAEFSGRERPSSLAAIPKYGEFTWARVFLWFNKGLNHRGQSYTEVFPPPCNSVLSVVKKGLRTSTLTHGAFTAKAAFKGLTEANPHARTSADGQRACAQ